MNYHVQIRNSAVEPDIPIPTTGHIHFLSGSGLLQMALNVPDRLEIDFNMELPAFYAYLAPGDAFEILAAISLHRSEGGHISSSSKIRFVTMSPVADKLDRILKSNPYLYRAVAWLVQKF